MIHGYPPHHSLKRDLSAAAIRRPTKLPWGIDIVFDIYKNVRRHTVLDAAAFAYQRYGNTFYQRFMGGDFINTIEPANIKVILSTNFSDYDMGTRRRRASLPLLGLGIFNNDGEAWRRSRRLFRPAFKNNELRSVEGLFELHCKNLLSAIPRDGSSVDLSELFFSYTMDVSTQYFFGNSALSLLELGGSERAGRSAKVFSCAFATAQDRIRENYVLGIIASFRPRHKFKSDRRVVWDFVDHYVDGALKGRRPQKTSQYSVLDHMAETSQDALELRSELLHLLLAARDTTASLLGNLWLMISQRQDVREAILQEIKCLEGKPPTYDELKAFTYLLNCISEALRLWPPVPLNSRTCVRATTLPMGGGLDGTTPLHIPVGTIVGWNTYALHRRADIWGDDAHEFHPERWKAPFLPYYEYLPFSGGPRRCLGQEFAILETSYVTVRLLQEFGSGTIGSVDARPWTEKLTLTCSNLHGTKVRILP
ncbi:cytochrome P450 [Rhizodiscina lignyota]|uniref:Cytochrome P450 n=1 Tax=Rhizodiscina lignyota TaxID=1504668 RepID=A0A9P4IBP8_9PEZI|nr:cytochrome P450 [Rhizodiscina lignyota]